MKQLTNEQYAYIAGFLDGDGSLIAQLVKGSHYKYGYHVRVSIVFYQRKDKYWFMMKLKNLLGYGYIRIRNDNIVEYTITGSEPLSSILVKLSPYIQLKKDILNKILLIIEKKKNINSKKDFENLCSLVDSTETLTYSKKRINKSVVLKNSP